MGLAEIQALKKLDARQVYKGKEPTERVKAMLKPKEKKPIAKQSVKAKAAKKEEVKLCAADKEFYAEIWAACPHKCEACNISLGKEPLTIYFHHALSKQSYPGFRHTVENIIVLCKDCHTQVEVDINKVPYVKKRTQQILKELLG